MAIYKANGKHINCYYDEMFYETLDNFQRDDSIVIVEVTGENFQNFRLLLQQLLLNHCV